jgi:hypothetical protein
MWRRYACVFRVDLNDNYMLAMPFSLPRLYRHHLVPAGHGFSAVYHNNPWKD